MWKTRARKLNNLPKVTQLEKRQRAFETRRSGSRVGALKHNTRLLFNGFPDINRLPLTCVCAWFSSLLAFESLYLCLYIRIFVLYIHTYIQLLALLLLSFVRFGFQG